MTVEPSSFATDQKPKTPRDQRYCASIRELSDRLVDAQKPIRILDAIKWDASIQQAFFAAGGTEQPPVDRDYYRQRPLSFDVDTKLRELDQIESDVRRTLGQFSPVGEIMRRMCREYITVVRMLEDRGAPGFARRSEELYGSSTDAFHAGDPTLADLGVQMSEALTNVDRSLLLQSEEKTITGEQAVSMLQSRLNHVFTPAGFPVRVVVSDGIVADAAAGSDYLKIRAEARFNERDIRLLEVHEGWVHLGTTLNGQSQPYCTFLGKGPPSSTVSQEGLAIFMEIIAFASHPGRLRRLTNRIQAVALAEQGATFLDVYAFFREQGFSNGESYSNAARVFRGSTPTGGPFTKDLSYSKGFVLLYGYVMLAVRKGLLDRVQLLFCGKTSVGDMRAIAQLVEEGVVVPPRYVPSPLVDLNALVAWMCYARFLTGLSLDRMEADYAGIL